ncbi:transposase, partial [Pseudoxanthomonas gei]
ISTNQWFIMKKSQFSEAKIVEILSLPSQGQSIEDICRQYNISPATFYNWRNRYGGMDTEELRKSKALEAENARLKKLLADKSLDYDILNDAYQLLKNR